MNEEGLSIIIPVYNEANGIENTINTLKKSCEGIHFDAEIIFVDDGSNDGTSKKLADGVVNQENVRAVTHDHNLGYGAALKTGIRISKYKYVAITDADETYPNDRIPELYEATLKSGVDMLVGARVGKNAKIPTIRKPAKWALNKLANYLAEYDIPDLNSGLRIMKKETLLKFISILPQGFSFTTTITLAMLTNGYRVRYEPIQYFHRAGTSKIRPIYDTLNFMQLIIRTVLLFRPLKVFLPISLMMFLMGIFLILYRVIFGAEFGVTATVIFVGAIQVLAIGMLADLIDRRMDS